MVECEAIFEGFKRNFEATHLLCFRQSMSWTVSRKIHVAMQLVR